MTEVNLYIMWGTYITSLSEEVVLKIIIGLTSNKKGGKRSNFLQMKDTSYGTL